MTDALEQARAFLAEAGCDEDFPDLELQSARPETRTFIESREFFFAQDANIADFFIGRRSYVLGGGLLSPHTVIGRYCSIAKNTGIGLNQHRMDWLSTGLLPQPSARPPERPDPPPPLTVIGSDVWIGLGAIVMDGIRIGHGACIGAGAVVTHDVEPYMVVAGVPARPIRRRFPDHLAQALLDSRWWSLPEELIRMLPYHDVDACVEFLERI